jgi:hypothetical protein
VELDLTQSLAALLAVGGAVYAGGQAARRAIPERVTQTAVWARALPLQPIFWGVVWCLALLPTIDSVAGIDYVWPVALLAGTWSGALGQSAYAVVRQTVLGNDQRISGQEG